MRSRIEQACGKGLVVSAGTTRPGNLAESGIDESGTSKITFSEATAPTLEFIVHELQHLLLTIEGFPSLELFGPSSLRPLVWTYLLDALQHHVFFPRLELLGYNPESFLALELDRVITYGFSRQYSEVELAGKYLAYLLEDLNGPLSQRMHDWYTLKGWDAARDRAEQAFNTVQCKDAWTPRLFSEGLVNCGNVLFDGVARMTRLRSYEEDYGAIKRRFDYVTICFGSQTISTQSLQRQLLTLSLCSRLFQLL